jgi:O-acetyl-ADP-ribose deacetylase (regulator of RNase III)
MGKLILKKGDCFTTTQPIICHGVNCSRGFASGFAAQVARLHPEVRQAYLDKYDRDGWRLGDYQVVELASPTPTLRMIANLGTQQFYGREQGRVYVDYDGLRTAVNGLFDYAEDLGMGVAMPRIGCGLAGGDWSIVSDIIAESIRSRSIDVETWSP